MIFGVMSRTPDSVIDVGLFEAVGMSAGTRQENIPAIVDGPVALSYSNPYRTTPYESPGPVKSGDGAVAVVFSGVIYNYAELEARAGNGGGLKGKSSAAALVEKLYRREGLDFINSLNGKFALAIADRRSASIHLVRDRFGIEPLYYYLDNDKVVFGSTVRQVVNYVNDGLDLDLGSLSRFLMFNYNPGLDTFYDQVQKLRPAHILTVDTNSTQIRPYWRLSFSDIREHTEQEWSAMLLDQLENAVKRRLDGDVSPGVFVSGGMDSSSILGIAHRELRSPLNTFSYRCGGASFDESHYARLMAEDTNSVHHEIEYCADDVLSMPGIVAQMDEPFCDIGINIATWLLGKEASQTVPCVLTGDGGDELFGGHPIYEADKIAQFVDPIPGFLKNPFFALGRMLPDSDKKKSLAIKIKRFSESLSYSPALLSHRWRIYYTMSGLQRLLSKEVYEAVRTHDPCEEILQYNAEADGTDLLSRCLYSDYQTVVDFYLRRNDLNREFGLETRYPMLDHELVEFCAGMPTAMKIRGWFDAKYIFKKAMEPVLPHKIVYREDKLGHSIPLKNWLRENAAVKELVFDHLSADTISRRGLFQRDYIERLINDHMKKRCNNSHRLWSLAVLEMWLASHETSRN